MQATKNTADNQLSQAFTFNASNQQVRVVTIDDEPYFVAKDVCDILELTNSRMTVQSLDEDERRKYCLPRQGDTWCVNESGLYHLIFQSRKPEAKAFRKWVTAEVLPALRKTGHYEVKPQATRKSVRYPRKGELINAEILELLWLIGESLQQGDQTAIAFELGVTRRTVGRVLAGQQRNSRVLGALYRRAQANRQNSVLYTSPAAMTSRLLKSGMIADDENFALPPLSIGGRGQVLGNQNARKQKSNSKK